MVAVSSAGLGPTGGKELRMKRIGIIGLALAAAVAATGAAFAAAMPAGPAVMLDAAADAADKDLLTTVQTTVEHDDWRATREIILLVQRTLTTMGYDPGPIDGAKGPSTRRAVRAYQKENEIEETGAITAALVERLENDMRAGDDEFDDEEASGQSAEAPGTEPVIEITDDPASYDLGDLSDLNSFD